MKKAIHFGAGNIGRGFIGVVLNQSDYDVVFADVNKLVVDALKQRRAYTVELIGEASSTMMIAPVYAFHTVSEKQALVEAILDADLITTAVGPSILGKVAESLAPAIALRAEMGIHKPLNVIACENMMGGSTQLKQLVYAKLSAQALQYCEDYVGFPDSAVDRIVPNQKHEDPLWVRVEPFFEWVVDSTKIKGELKLMEVHFTDNLIAFIERKLFVVNAGHASAAYVGYQKGYKTIKDALADHSVRSIVLDVMRANGQLVCHKHGFEPEAIEQYIQKTLSRFSNPEIIDEIVRVARSPLRKLSPNDRFIKPLLEAESYQLDTSALERVISMILAYDEAQDEEADRMQAMILSLGIEKAFSEISSIPTDCLVLKRICNLVTK